ncbi:MAG: YfhO family protein, partial [Bacteroidales bacterium]|nr:YfhO family protein [Bacteroidales bacterium]
ITLTDYKPNYLSYKTNTHSDQLAVFSEIYYAKGWQAYIDGKPVPHFRADYILRAMKIPEGIHKIEFKFEPSIWKTENSISLIGSVLFVLVILGGLFWIIKKKKIKEKQ